jgi:hypothetical protein
MGCTVWGSSPFAIRAPNVFAKVEQVDTEFLSGDIELSPISAETAGTSSTTDITCTLPVDDAHATLPAFKACPTHSIAFMANRRLALAAFSSGATISCWFISTAAVAAWPEPRDAFGDWSRTASKRLRRLSQIAKPIGPSYQLRSRSYFRHTHHAIIALVRAVRGGIIATIEGTNPWRKWLTWMRIFGENERRKHAEWPSGSPQRGLGMICLLLRTDMSAWRRRQGNASNPSANGYDAAGV